MTRPARGTFGWCSDLADHRDLSPSSEAAKAMLGRLRRPRGQRSAASAASTEKVALPDTVDWHEFAGPVEDQGDWPTATAHAAAGLVQFFERRSTGQLLRPSRLFIDAAARRTSFDQTGGVSLRGVFKSLKRFGAPPEMQWPYAEEQRLTAPDVFCLGYSRGYRSIRYVRLDSSKQSSAETLEIVRAFLAAGFAISFGFAVPSSMNDEPEIHFPLVRDEIVGGQAAMALGYDDRLRIGSDKGALLIRNSWGTSWGNGGYGWLPYSFVVERLAIDFWTLLKPSWLRSGEFESPLLRGVVSL